MEIVVVIFIVVLAVVFYALGGCNTKPAQNACECADCLFEVCGDC